MNKILVTGATGHLGRLTIAELLKRVPADRIVALVRDPAKAEDLAAQGVLVRQGNYFDTSSLLAAFRDVEKVMLISAEAFSDRLTQHLNVINAAKDGGVRHIVYTSIQRKPGSDFEITSITASDIATEDALKASGLDYTILQNGLYIDVVPAILGPNVLSTGVRVLAGGGRSPIVARIDLAEGNAVVLTEAGHENRTYILGASEAFSFEDIASALTELRATSVPYLEVSNAEFIADRVKEGFPAPAAAFLAEWVDAVQQGELAQVTGDLHRLIGRKPIGYREFFALEMTR